MRKIMVMILLPLALIMTLGTGAALAAPVRGPVPAVQPGAPHPVQSDCFSGVGIFQTYRKAFRHRKAGTFIHWSQVVRCKALPQDMNGMVCLWKVHTRTTAEDLNCTTEFDERDLARHRLGHQDGLYWRCPSTAWAGDYYAQADYWGDDPGPYMKNHAGHHQDAISLCSDVEHFTCNAHHTAVIREASVHIHPDTHVCIPRRNAGPR